MVRYEVEVLVRVSAYTTLYVEAEHEEQAALTAERQAEANRSAWIDAVSIDEVEAQEVKELRR